MPYEWVDRPSLSVTTDELIKRLHEASRHDGVADELYTLAAERLATLDARVRGLQQQLEEARDDSIVISSSEGDEICVIETSEAREIIKYAVEDYINKALRQMIVTETESVLQSAHGQEHDGEDSASS